jgi:poly(3-hydroxybutyrate) depolymerase
MLLSFTQRAVHVRGAGTRVIGSEMIINASGKALVVAVALFCSSLAAAEPATSDRLLRLDYESAATGHRREYFVFLPVGYDQEAGRKWPVMLFLHGNARSRHRHSPARSRTRV